MRLKKRSTPSYLFFTVVVVCLVILLTAVFLYLKKSQNNSSPDNQPYKVIYAVDGDTIIVDGNKKVRYIGMNAPETVEKNKPVDCYGPEASQANKNLVENKLVYLKKDVSETDKYGRLLRYVWTADGVFVNDYLVRYGFAKTMPIKPDLYYSKQIYNSQKQAKVNNLGLWRLCSHLAKP